MMTASNALRSPTRAGDVELVHPAVDAHAVGQTSRADRRGGRARGIGSLEAAEALERDRLDDALSERVVAQSWAAASHISTPGSTGQPREVAADPELVRSAIFVADDHEIPCRR